MAEINEHVLKLKLIPEWIAGLKPNGEGAFECSYMLASVVAMVTGYDEHFQPHIGCGGLMHNGNRRALQFDVLPTKPYHPINVRVSMI